jgi:NADPH2:quinone reductase
VIRADAFGPPEVLVPVREPMPQPGSGEALVRVEAVGVNFADTMLRRGTYLRGQEPPVVPGMELTGTVLAAGEGVEVPEGDTVLGFLEGGGAYADHALVPGDRLYRVPADLPAPVRAALFVHGVTSWYAVHRFGRVQPGEHVLVHAAAGGLGGVCTQLAAAAGATVIATASTEEKQAIASENGASVAFAADPEKLRDRVRELTGGRGCDVVIDGVGGPLFAPSYDALANRGRYVVAGSTTQEPAMLDVRRLMPRGQTVVGFIVRRVIEVEPDEPQATIDLVVEMLREGSLRLPLTTFPLEEAAEAHRLLESRQHTGKLVLIVS